MAAVLGVFRSYFTNLSAERGCVVESRKFKSFVLHIKYQCGILYLYKK